ncbi:MAG: single-stranded DNA-binding protein [bacterium]
MKGFTIMASYNRIIIMGNLTRDPELKQLATGQSVCRFGLASNRQFKNRQTGMMIQEVCFVDVDVWGAQADSCKQYLQKGRLALVEGRLKFDSWEDADGNRRSRHSIVADRVTFLPATTSAQAEDQDVAAAGEVDASASQPVAPARKAAVKSKKDEIAQDIPQTGEISLKNEQPFEDDLPF